MDFFKFLILFEADAPLPSGGPAGAATPAMPAPSSPPMPGGPAGGGGPMGGLGDIGGMGGGMPSGGPTEKTPPMEIKTKDIWEILEKVYLKKSGETNDKDGTSLSGSDINSLLPPSIRR